MIAEIVGTIAETAAKGIEKLSEAASEVKEKVVDLDRPLKVEDVENITDAKEKAFSLDELDKPLNGEISEYDERGFRYLTEEEKRYLLDHTNWSDKEEGIQGCKINDEGLIKYPCRNERFAGIINPSTGIEYERRIVGYNGLQVEVVVPKFPSVFDVQLPDDLLEAKDKTQFCECNKQLYDTIQNNSNFAKKFTSEQIEQIKDGITRGGAPEGYTWHHDAETGKLQLVDSDIHAESRHTGGKALWGGGHDNR